MFSRLLIIVMLVLFPLQWSVAQGHELRDDARDLSLQAPADKGMAKANPGHTQDPGGVCQFHELAHASAMDLTSSYLCCSRQRGQCWTLAVAPNGAPDAPLSDIERPKWPRCNLVAATL